MQRIVQRYESKDSANVWGAVTVGNVSVILYVCSEQKNPVTIRYSFHNSTALNSGATPSSHTDISHSGLTSINFIAQQRIV